MNDDKHAGPLAAINEFCESGCDDRYYELSHKWDTVEECRHNDCPLYPYRNGEMPIDNVNPDDCPHCGASNFRGDTKCYKCGGKLY